MSDFEQANVRVTEAVYRFERALAEATRAARELAAAEEALALHRQSSPEERAIACRGTGSARVALAVLVALQGESVEARPVHVVTCTCEAQWRRTGSASPWPGSHVTDCPRRGAALPPTAAATDLSDCTCAIPAKPPNEHGRNCPVFLRWAGAAGAAGGVIGTSHTLGEVESAIRLIVRHKMPWCRARLLHAIGAAEEQGILHEVLLELLGELPSVGEIEAAEAMRETLRRRGWAT